MIWANHNVFTIRIRNQVLARHSLSYFALSPFCGTWYKHQLDTRYLWYEQPDGKLPGTISTQGHQDVRMGGGGGKPVQSTRACGLEGAWAKAAEEA